MNIDGEVNMFKLNENDPDGQKLLDVRALAEALSVKKSHVYNMVERGQIPHFRIGGCIRFKLEDVLAETERVSKVSKEIARNGAK
jgi:excisionase family DNA binding protein